MKSLFLPISVCLVLVSFTTADKKIKLFNGKNFDGWYTFLENNGKNNDPDKVFTIENGMIHITGKEFGYMATNASYENYRLVLEFKWGTKKWPPREKEKKDSGVIYHIPDTLSDRVWPTGVECQIQEGDCGDFWLVGGIKMNTKNKSEEQYGFTHITKTIDAEKPHGEWNKVEIIADKNKCTHIINGKMVNEGTEVTSKKGRIIFQSEGAEIYFRNIELYPL